MLDTVKQLAEDQLCLDINNLKNLRARVSLHPELVEFIDIACRWQSERDPRVCTFLGFENVHPALFPERLRILTLNVLAGGYRVVWVKKVWVEDAGQLVEFISDVECPECDPRLEYSDNHQGPLTEVLTVMRRPL